jgi:hypothetical protein
MKKLIALTTCLLTAVFLFAQPQKQQDNRRQKEWERLQSEKIAFITAELDLTPEEAQVFWPVYNQCWKEVHAANKSMREAFSEFRGKKGDELSDKELEKKLDAYVQSYKASNQVLTDWYPKFKQVLPIRKVAKLYQAEEAFQQRMINNLRKPHPQQRPQKED